MGNCCGGGSKRESNDSEHRGLTKTSKGKPVKAFHGEGHRLGTASELNYQNNGTATSASIAVGGGEEQPTPERIDHNLTDEERAKIRADRAAAAEARLKTQKPKTGKKKSNDGPPLTGPNSKPLMTWRAG